MKIHLLLIVIIFLFSEEKVHPQSNDSSVKKKFYVFYECEISGTCSQVDVGGYKCSCADDYIKDPRNSTRCKAVEWQASLWFAHKRGISKITLDNLEMIPVSTDTATFDVNLRAGLIFWYNIFDKKIYQAPVNDGNNRIVLVESGPSNEVTNLAIDWIYSNIYWTDSRARTIKVANFERNITKTLIKHELHFPCSLALNPGEGWMYWSVTGSRSRIERAGMDGSSRQTIVKDDIPMPTTLTLDLALRKVYWFDKSLKIISSCNYDGSGRRVIFGSQEFLQDPFSITIFEDWIYWSDLYLGSLYKADKFTGQNISAVPQKTDIPYNDPRLIQIYHPTKQPQGENYCRISNGNCSHLCLPAPQVSPESPKITCACPAGLQLTDDNRTCDVNKCDIPGTCSQICENKLGGFTCSCMDGYIKDPRNSTRCKAAEAQVFLLFSHNYGITKISLDNLETTPVTTEAPALTFDLNCKKGLIFWHNIFDKKLYKAPINDGSNQTVLMEIGPLHGITNLAVDWIYSNIYWIDPRVHTIEVANFERNVTKTLIKYKLHIPSSLALNPSEGWMYWSVVGSGSRIERAGMDGSSRQTIVKDEIPMPTSLTLDLVLRKVYWFDKSLKVISSCNYDGSGRRIIFSSRELNQDLFSIVTFEDWMYWSDWSLESLYKADKFTGQNISTVLDTSDNGTWQIQIYHPSKQPHGENHCQPFNGNCSHLCLSAPQINAESPRISCACPAGLKLLDDNRTCVVNECELPRTCSHLCENEVENLNCNCFHGNVKDSRNLAMSNPTERNVSFLFTQKSEIKKISLENQELRKTIPMENETNTFDFDFRTGMIYWNDDLENVIYKAPIEDGNNQTVLIEVNQYGGVTDIAIDWIYNHIYWLHFFSIEMANLEGNVKKTLIQYDRRSPMCIALNPTDGWMYFGIVDTETNKATIERAGMDGSYPHSIVDRDVAFPSSLVLDLVVQKVYWADTALQVISSSNYDGSGRRNILCSVEFLPFKCSITIFEDAIYWYDVKSQSLSKADKFTGMNVSTVIDMSYAPSKIRLYHPYKQPIGENYCGISNGNCSHLCLPAPQINSESPKITCSCPNRFEWTNDNRTCIRSQGW